MVYILCSFTETSNVTILSVQVGLARLQTSDWADIYLRRRVKVLISKEGRYKGYNSLQRSVKNIP